MPEKPTTAAGYGERHVQIVARCHRVRAGGDRPGNNQVRILHRRDDVESRAGGVVVAGIAALSGGAVTIQNDVNVVAM